MSLLVLLSRHPRQTSPTARFVSLSSILVVLREVVALCITVIVITPVTKRSPPMKDAALCVFTEGGEK